MSEKDKMLCGELHFPGNDPELMEERQNCKELCYLHNYLSPKEAEKRLFLLKEILGKYGKAFWIEQPFMCDYGYNIEIGEKFYSNHNLLILDSAKVTFGDNVFLGPNCSFYTVEHPLDSKTRITGAEWAEPITVGNNVWIGGNVTVLRNVKIGDNSVIGAGSVVTKDIPPNCVAAGNPCKVIKQIEN